jgi:hypothetical protein
LAAALGPVCHSFVCRLLKLRTHFGSYLENLESP